MALSPPLPPGPAAAFNRRLPPQGLPMGAITVRLILVSLAVIGFLAFRAVQIEKKQAAYEAAQARAAADAARAGLGGATLTAIPGVEGATGTAAAPDVPLPPRSPDDPRLVNFHGRLDGVADYEDVAQNQAYAALANHVHSLKDDEAARIIRKDIDFLALTRAPGNYRGELIRVDGMLIQLEAVRLAPGAGPKGVENAWRGWLMEPGGDECFVFDLIGDAPDVSKRDIVRVEGTFLKILRYENQKGKERDAPFLIARKAWRIDEERELERPFRYDYLAAVLVSVVAAVVIVLRKRAADEQSLLEAKRDELARRAARRAKDAGAGGEAKA